MEEEKSRAEQEIESIREKLISLKKEKDEIQNEIKRVEAEQRSHEDDKIANIRDEYKISKQEH